MIKCISLIFILAFSCQSMFACKCESIDDIKDEFKATDVIVHGKVISKEYVTFLSTLNKKGLRRINSKNTLEEERQDSLYSKDILKIGMEILYTYKGKKIKKNIIIYTSRLSGACGYRGFNLGEEYQVYLSKNCYFRFIYKNASLDNSSYNGYWTNICTRTSQFSSEEDRNLKSLMN